MPQTENEEKKGGLSWVVFVLPVSFLLIAASLYLYTPNFWQPASLFLVVGISVGWINSVSFRFTEIIVTNASVIIRRGWLTRQTLEIPFAQIESVDIVQHIFGQIFDYGSLYIVGTGSTQTVIQQLNHPNQWRESLKNAIAAARAR